MVSNRKRQGPWLWLITLIGVIVPRRLRTDWRQEWEAELRYREARLAQWNQLNSRTKLDLLWHSAGASMDALWLQPRRWEDEMIQDLRFGLRMLLKNKSFSTVAVLSLALGIGANTAIFSVVNGLLLRPLPYRRSEQLVKVFQTRPDSAKGSLPSVWSYPRFEILRDNNQSFDAVAGFTQNAYNLTGTDNPERLQVEMVSASYFPLLGVETIIGRTFAPEEDQTPGANLTALVSYGLWQRRFGGNVQVLGQTIEIDKHSFTVVGVLPPGFRGQSGTAEAWVTMLAGPVLRYPRILTNPNNYWFQVIGRLKEGVSLARAQADMPLISEQIQQRFPAPKNVLTANAQVPAVVPLQTAKVDPVLKRSFLILLAAVGMLLLITCANVANLLLARAVARKREFALRTALGSGRVRLMRQLITESLVLALLGGGLGVLVARGALELLQQFRPSDNGQFWTSYTRAFDFFTIDLDWRVLIFTFALTLLTGLLFGLAPALQSSFVNVNQALKEGGGGPTVSSHGVRKLSARRLIVAGEIAISVMLLIGAGLMLKSLARLQAVYLGFVPENVLTMQVPSRDAKPAFYDQLRARVETIPGVEAASVGSTAPLLGYSSKTVIDIDGRPDTEQAGVGLLSVSPEYFKTLGITMLRGRAFTAQDRVGAPRVAIINQSAVEKLFSGDDPIGKRVRPYIEPAYDTEEKSCEIVGVVADVRYGRLEEAIEPDLYVSSLQPTDAAQTLIVRTPFDPTTITAAVRREVLTLDPDIPLTSIQTMGERAAEVTSRTRFVAMLLGLFATLALTLSAIGIYGVMAYSVSARRPEIGIRMALGAQSRDVLGMVLRDGLTLIGSGLTLGACAAVVSLRVLQSQLYDVRVTDPLTFAGAALLLAGVGLLACYLPARRAAQTDPIQALRYE